MFMATAYRRKVERGRWILRERPAAASSWSLKDIQKVLNMNEVDVVTGDQFVYGLKAWGVNGRMEARAQREPASCRTEGRS